MLAMVELQCPWHQLRKHGRILENAAKVQYLYSTGYLSQPKKLDDLTRTGDGYRTGAPMYGYGA
jgi:hypothetical protein